MRFSFSCHSSLSSVTASSHLAKYEYILTSDEFKKTSCFTLLVLFSCRSLHTRTRRRTSRLLMRPLLPRARRLRTVRVLPLQPRRRSLPAARLARSSRPVTRRERRMRSKGKPQMQRAMQVRRRRLTKKRIVKRRRRVKKHAAGRRLAKID